MDGRSVELIVDHDDHAYALRECPADSPLAHVTTQDKRHEMSYHARTRTSRMDGSDWEQDVSREHSYD